MAEILSVVISFLTGGLLGLIFFGGLHWTVGRGLSSKYAALWFTASLISRLIIVLGGFYLVSDRHIERLSICLLGFLMAQLMVIFFTRVKTKPSGSSSGKVSHAPIS